MFDICAASGLILLTAAIMHERLYDAMFNAKTRTELQQWQRWERIASEVIRWASVAFVVSGCFSGIELLLLKSHFG